MGTPGVDNYDMNLHGKCNWNPTQNHWKYSETMGTKISGVFGTVFNFMEPLTKINVAKINLPHKDSLDEPLCRISSRSDTSKGLKN